MTKRDIVSQLTHNKPALQLDITGAEDIEIMISRSIYSNKELVLWVSTKEGTRLRICQIKGKISIIDNRKKLKK